MGWLDDAERDNPEVSGPYFRMGALEELRRQALIEADKMVAGKASDYGHFSSYPQHVHAALMFVKVQRALNITTRIYADPGYEVAHESLKDTCLDLVNYASFLYALACADEPRKEEEQP